MKFILSKKFKQFTKGRLYHIGDLPKWGTQFKGKKNDSVSIILHSAFHNIEVRDACDSKAAVLSFFTCSPDGDRFNFLFFTRILIILFLEVFWLYFLLIMKNVLRHKALKHRFLRCIFS